MDPQTPDIAAAGDTAPADTPAAAPKRNKALVIVLIVVGVLVLAGGALVAWKLSSGSSTPSTGAGQSSRKLYAAWKSGNRSAAGAVATDSGVREMFAIKPNPNYRFQFGGCTKPTKSPWPKLCVWTQPGGMITMKVEESGGKRKVTSVKLGPAALPPTSTG